MLSAWVRFQNGAWWLRWSVKTIVLGLTVFLVCYPYPSRFWRHIMRWQAPEQLIEPAAPGLEPWLDDLRPRLEGVQQGPEALEIVEQYVYGRLKYAWDWETWGVADYLPTVEETLAVQQEDCDGRAVVAASLLRGLGYEAELVTDMMHVWVKTDYGETMSPGRMKKFVETEQGQLNIDWSALANLPRSWAFGVSVFPFTRELIVLGVLLVLSLRPGVRWWVYLLAGGLLFDGLIILRLATWRSDLAQWLGLCHLVAALVLLWTAGRRVRRANSGGAGAFLSRDRKGAELSGPGSQGSEPLTRTGATGPPQADPPVPM